MAEAGSATLQGVRAAPIWNNMLHGLLVVLIVPTNL